MWWGPFLLIIFLVATAYIEWDADLGHPCEDEAIYVRTCPQERDGK
jgi:hypothetical protein